MPVKNYLTGTFIDNDSVITPDSTGANFTGFVNNNPNSIYWSWTPSGDFTHQIDGIITGFSGEPIMCCYAVSEIIGDFKAFIDHPTAHSVSVYFRDHATAKGIYILEMYNGTPYATTKYVYADNIQHYLSIGYTNSTKLFILSIYSNEARTSLLATINLTLHQALSTSYLYGINNYSIGNAVNRQMTGRFENLDIREEILAPYYYRQMTMGDL